MDLAKGGNVALSIDDQPLLAARVLVAWSPRENIDLDVSVLLLDVSGRVRGDHDFVFYNQPEGEDGAVRLLGKSSTEQLASDRLHVSLGDLSGDVGRIVVLVSLDAEQGIGFGTVEDLEVQVTTADEQVIVRFAVPSLGPETAVIVGELYRRDSAWRFRAIGQGYASGLAGVAADYGITVDDADEPNVGVREEEDQSLSELTDPDAPADSGSLSEPSELSDADQQLEASGAQVALPVAPAVAAQTDRRAASVRTRKQPLATTPVRALTLGEDDSWRAARLFPIVGIGGADEQERRATSALLAVLMGVKEFGRAIAGRLGAPAGLIETYLLRGAVPQG